MTGESAPFGERLRNLREAAGLTQEELAARAGLTAKAVSALERGERKRPYPHTVRSLADALGLGGEERATLAASVPRRGAENATPEESAGAVSAIPAAPLTPLVGREREVEEIVGLLGREEVRLLTLTGLGASARRAWPSRLRGRPSEASPMAWPSSASPRSGTPRS